MKSSGIGGQAVIEGVMMKNKDIYAVAVRKPNNEIAIEKNTFVSTSDKYKVFKFPILRGILAFIESMVIGMKTLTFSASFYEEEEEVKPSKLENAFTRIFKDKAEKVVMGITIMIAIAMAIGIFMLLPFFIAEFFQSKIESQVILAVIEGAIRIAIFIAYVMAISQMKDIKRVFQYHGAEHKTINCIEHGFELTVENVRFQTKEHKRCGTSFMLIVMFFSILFFLFIRTDSIWLRIVVRLLLVPVIAGVAYEFIRLAGRSDSKLVNVLSKPGLWLQGLTTKEPDDEMIEVAIQSVEAVFDWRAYLVENENKEDNKVDNKADNKEDNKADNKEDNKEDETEETVQVADEFGATDESKLGNEDEEEDEILRALDKFFILNQDKKDE